MSKIYVYVLGGILGFTLVIGALTLGYRQGYLKSNDTMHLKCAKATLMRFEGDPTIYGCARIPAQRHREELNSNDSI